MSTIAEVSPGSFDSYEGIRIVIPGLIMFSAGVATFSTIAPEEDLGLARDALVGLVSALVVGLLLYFWDIPSRCASYNENQPTEYLEREYPAIGPSELLTAYLLLLNTTMPSNTRNRSLYMGSMYRIGVEMVLALSAAAYLVFACSLFNYGPSIQHGAYSPRLIAGSALILCFGFVTLVAYSNERRSADRALESMTRIGKAILGDLRRRSTLVYVAGLLMIFISLTPLLDDPVDSRLLAVSGMGMCFGYWVFRYIRGVQIQSERPRRRRFHSVTSGILFLAPLVCTLFLCNVTDESVLGETSLLTAWTGAAAVALASIVIRGHERKLHGAYMGQTRWLKENPAAVQAVLGSSGSDQRAPIDRGD